MSTIFRSELYRIQRRLQTRVLLLIMGLVELVIIGGFTVAHFLDPADQEMVDAVSIRTMSNGSDGPIPTIYMIGLVMVVVFSATLVGSEYRWNTLRPLLARSPRRNALLSAKWATSVVYVVVFAVYAVGFALLLSTIGTLIVGAGFEWTGEDVVMSVEAVARLIVVFLPWAAIALTAALVTRSNAAGIALGIAYAVVEPLMIGLLASISSSFRSLERGSVAYNSERIWTFGGEDDATFSQVVSSAGVLALWVTALVGVSYWLFNRRDVTGD